MATKSYPKDKGAKAVARPGLATKKAHATAKQMADKALADIAPRRLKSK